jgi:uncharacterized protein YqgQ
MDVSLNKILTYDIVSNPAFLESKLIFNEENRYIRKRKIKNIFNKKPTL